MILSFHPLFTGDKNILCAGRQPDRLDLQSIQSADAVILPQGCRRSLHDMARNHCSHVFPDYRMRFRYPGKTGQTQLFSRFNVLFPKTQVFRTTQHFYKGYPRAENFTALALPFVFKFDWGGEGDTVFLVTAYSVLRQKLDLAFRYEQSGQSGFLLQEYIPSSLRCLRVVVIGQKMIAYWRKQEDPNTFGTNLAKGGQIDMESDPELRQKGIASARIFCHQTGINLAGFDLLFSADDKNQRPYFLEINYFFGRRGLGGSEKYYSILEKEIREWLSNLNL